MPEHAHGCLSCRPDMVPDFDPDDPRYHDGAKCNFLCYAVIDGTDPGYTCGIFEGPEGWALIAGPDYDVASVHPCSCGESVCVEPRFGHVEAGHRCPSMHPTAACF